MREILCLNNVSLTYQAENGEVSALENVSISAGEGELIAIVGPSGCGKSTLLSLIAGLVSPTKGSVVIAGEQVRGVSGVSAHIGYMLQKDNLLDWRTIRSNVLIGLEIRKILTPENVAYVDGLLATYGLSEFQYKYPSQLSGGMRQRAALIRTLAAKPELLLLDEAFSALDYQTRLAVTDDVFRILKSKKKTAVIVTHDIPESISMADRIVVMTAHPGCVRAVYNVEFKRPDGSIMPPLERRRDTNFGRLFNLIWKELDINVPI